MNRSFRIFGKKRGHRHTGSKTLGSAGEALFFALLLIAGTTFLILLLATRVVPEWRANHDFVQDEAVVLEKRIAERRDSDGNPAYRAEVRLHLQDQAPGDDDSIWRSCEITGVYSANREAQQALLDNFEIGREYAAWYDPLNPTVAVLVRGYSWFAWLLVLVPSGFILIGGGGLIYSLWHWGKSAEHRAARTSWAGSISSTSRCRPRKIFPPCLTTKILPTAQARS